MSLLQAIIMGIIQGLTEFLPVSSSAHLVIAPFFLGWEIPEEQIFPFDVLVQLGTLLAVIAYFLKDLWNILRAFIAGLVRGQPFADPLARMGWYLILATIPGGLIGLLIKDTVEAAFNSLVITALFLFGTTSLLLFSEKVGSRSRPIESLDWKDALWMGFGQALALFPGISRSGATIAAGLTRHLERPAAGRFSFLMSVPIMLAAGLVASLDLVQTSNLTSFLPVMAAGFMTSAVVGYFAIHWLLNFMVRHSLRVFAIYTAALAVLTLVVAYVRP